MAEYWVSKKQYWCKYCNIWVRDDAPSKRLHESGLKHQGSKERFIRDLYRGGERAKRDKVAEQQEMARIEAAAKSAFAKDTGGSGIRIEPPRAVAPASSSSSRTRGTGDKWANYTTASQLGLADEDVSSYEIEQLVRGKKTAVGEWEEIKVPDSSTVAQAQIVHGEDGVPQLAAPPVPDEDDENAANFKFSHRDKRPVRDVYDDDDWDPAAVQLNLKRKERKVDEVEPGPAAVAPPEVKEERKAAGWDRSGWSGKLELKEGDEGAREAEVKVKVEEGETAAGDSSGDAVNGVGAEIDAPEVDRKPPVDTKPDTAQADAEPAVPDTAAPPPPTSMFKKRRPPPSSRKK